MSYEEAKEMGFGVAKKPDSDHPNAPKLKGWVKAAVDIKAGEFVNFTLWTSKKERGAFNIQLHESLKRSGGRDGEVKDSRPRPAAKPQQEFPDPFDNVDF